jgi:hypothetical protein
VEAVGEDLMRIWDENCRVVEGKVGEDSQRCCQRIIRKLEEENRWIFSRKI